MFKTVRYWEIYLEQFKNSKKWRKNSQVDPNVLNQVGQEVKRVGSITTQTRFRSTMVGADAGDVIGRGNQR